MKKASLFLREVLGLEIEIAGVFGRELDAVAPGEVGRRIVGGGAIGDSDTVVNRIRIAGVVSESGSSKSGAGWIRRSTVIKTRSGRGRVVVGAGNFIGRGECIRCVVAIATKIVGRVGF